MIIGKFDKDAEGFYGKISTMTLNIGCSIKPAKNRANEKSPTHHVFAKAGSGLNIGAGWEQTSTAGNDYISIKLDCPGLPAPINANLIEKDDKYLLMWDRD